MRVCEGEEKGGKDDGDDDGGKGRDGKMLSTHGERKDMGGNAIWDAVVHRNKKKDRKKGH